MDIIPIPNIFVCKDVLGLQKGYEVHKACICNDFCSVHTLEYQINLFKKLVGPIDVRSLCKLMGISTQKYYKCVKCDQVFNVRHNISNNELLKDIDEELLINCIKNAQLDNACLTGKEVRNISSELYFKRTTIPN